MEFDIVDLFERRIKHILDQGAFELEHAAVGHDELLVAPTQIIAQATQEHEQRQKTGARYDPAHFGRPDAGGNDSGCRQDQQHNELEEYPGEQNEPVLARGEEDSLILAQQPVKITHAGLGTLGTYGIYKLERLQVALENRTDRHP